MMAGPVRTLERYVVTARPRRLSPFRLVGGAWVTNAKRVRVQRAPGQPMRLALVARHQYASLLTKLEVEYVERIAARRGWILDVKPNPLTIQVYPHLDGDLDCNADLLAALNRVGKRLGVIVFVRSGRRTLAEQQALWDQYGPPRAARPNPNAPHVRGVAADVGIDGRDIGDYPGARDAMKAEGLSLRVPGEDWHVELGGVWNA
jgi:hypothetical protein